MKQLNILLLLVIPFFLSCGGDDDATTQIDTTDDMPVEEFSLTTNTITNITQIKATSGGTIVGISVNEILEQGVVYSLTTNPTLTDFVQITNANNLEFSVEITGLEVATSYFLRAYIKTESETFYGNEITFNTLMHKEFNGIPILTSQSAVDSFFGGGWTKIAGFKIEEEVNGNITNLNALSGLLEVGGAGVTDDLIEIIGNENLQSLSGLNNMNFLGGGILLSQNALTNLSALESLENLDGSITIAGELITNLSALQNLNSVSGRLSISGNDNLQDLNGLSSLENLGTELVIIGNDLLYNFCGLDTAINNGYSDYYIVLSNAYNPTLEDLQNGDCSL